MKILIHVRAWNKEFYCRLANIAFENPDITTIADFRGLADVWSGDYLYDSCYDVPNEEFEKEKDDIITRCRFLRSISRQKAEELARRFWNGTEKLFQEGKYDLVLSPIADCYTMDIIERIAEKYHVEYFALVTSFVRGYSRFTKQGELFDAKRQVTDEEIDHVIGMLVNDDYKVTFSLNKEKKQFDTAKFYLRRRMVDKLYFPYKKNKEKDPWNYHYNTLSFQGGNYADYSVKNAERYYKKISEADIQKKSVYVPLHYSPEATVDYWCDNKKWAYYEQSVIDFIKASDPGVSFVVKEHPAMYGKRNINFYKELTSMENVQLIHPYENSNQLLRELWNVMVYTGSVGVEALLRGKKVFTVTDNYYSGCSSNIVKTERIKAGDLIEEKLEHDNQKFMRQLLSGMFPGSSTAGKDIGNSEIDKIAAEMHRIYVNHVTEKNNR